MKWGGFVACTAFFFFFPSVTDYVRAVRSGDEAESGQESCGIFPVAHNTV